MEVPGSNPGGPIFDEFEGTKLKKEIIRFLKKRYGARIRFGQPFEVLVRCIISQRTKDEITDVVFSRLWETASDPQSIIKLGRKKLEEILKPAGFRKQKAKRIYEAAKFVAKHGIKPDREFLLKIPGVGYKCADIILMYAFRKPSIAVDTHVYRIAKRLGIAAEDDNREVVREKLQHFFPKKYWYLINQGFVKFGKEICKPRNPKCEVCPFAKFCAFAKASSA